MTDQISGLVEIDMHNPHPSLSASPSLARAEDDLADGPDVCARAAGSSLNPPAPRRMVKAARHLHLIKLPIKLAVIKCQPLTKTNSRSLNGSEISTGGSIIIPMLISTVEMTISMMRNGK